ncbi:MAG: tRNA pseudouridine(38-40) synthase TruA [Eubacteriales bacterium]
MKHNYKMTVSYDGTSYYGWEHQPGQKMTIQGKLETVLTRMLEAEHGDDGTEVTPVTVIGAGRTDAGVHARAMTANVILDTEMSEQEIQRYMNRYLPDDISIDELRICADRFHSRFMARGKTYRYTCWYSPEGALPVFERKYVTVLDRMPDLQKMKRAAEDLTGMHDFRSFCGNSHMKKSTVRVIDAIDIRQRGCFITITVHGSGFLQNMVRIICGTLLETGYGRRDPESMGALLAARDRKLAGPTAPAKGLTLLSVDY